MDVEIKFDIDECILPDGSVFQIIEGYAGISGEVDDDWSVNGYTIDSVHIWNATANKVVEIDDRNPLWRPIMEYLATCEKRINAALVDEVESDPDRVGGSDDAERRADYRAACGY